MPNKNKSKGTYHEKWLVDWLIERGYTAKRQPLSGSLGGEWSGDLLVDVMGHRLVGEMKYRDASSFPSPFTVLEGRDIAFYKRRRGSPQMVVIMTADTFDLLMGEHHARSAEPDDY